jgi:uncharacterized protein
MSQTLTVTVPNRLGWLAGGALVGVLAVVMAGPALTSVHAQDTTTPTEHTLSVTGTGIVFVKPDIADVTLGVSVQRGKAREAEVAAAAEMQKIIEALKAQGIAEEDIQTATLSLEPIYDYEPTPAKLIGYQATNIVSVTIRDITRAGAVVDAAADAGATSIGGISFRLDDQSAVEAQARDLAMTNARAKADALATAAGVTITGVITISEYSAPTPGPIPYDEGRDAAAAGRPVTPVLGGNIQLMVSVSVVYSIP